jgi:hypothetical protein
MRSTGGDPRTQKIRDKVVGITGASSGLWLTTVPKWYWVREVLGARGTGRERYWARKVLGAKGTGRERYWARKVLGAKGAGHAAFGTTAGIRHQAAERRRHR